MSTNLSDLIGPELYNDISTLYNSINGSDEFEYIFRKVNYEKYLSIMKYLKLRSQQSKLPLITEDTLDIVYNETSEKSTDNTTEAVNETDIIIDNVVDNDDTITGSNVTKSYRITIQDMQNINKYMKMLHQKRNHVIVNVLANLIRDGDKTLIGMIKTKAMENTVDVNDLNMRVRLSGEKPMNKNDLETLSTLHRDNIMKINFRLKQRVTLYVEGNQNSDSYVKIDLTITKTTKTINRIDTVIPRYELEIETVSKKPEKSLFEKVNSTALVLLKIMQQSNWICTETASQKVLNDYKEYLALKDRVTSLDGRQSFSLEIQHLTEILPNRYAVTDKADGERNMLIITGGRAYFISTNLVVKDSGIVLKTNEYDGTILDGELIFLPKKNRHMFLIFDCIYVGKNDMRKSANLFDRLNAADKVVEDCFILGKQKGYKQQPFKQKGDAFDLNELLDYHHNEIAKMIDDLNHDIDIETKFPLVRRKYFIGVTGAKQWEIFAYASLMYKLYTEDKNIKTPYLLDGLVFQPMEQQYITNVKESKYNDFKWKPPVKNSVDFFVEFEKDKETGKQLIVYDNSIDEYVKNKPYKICKLHVGMHGKTGEQPVPFRPDEGLNLAYLYLENGEARDLNGDIIQDKTVVEFYFNPSSQADSKYRWIPIRTRNDKTESVIKYRRKYGNYIDVANKVWRSIKNPILLSDFDELAKGGSIYDKKIASMRSKISHELIITATKENTYYQKSTNLAKPMRNFHNFIKSNIIYTYCSPTYEDNKSQSILDIACGRGGDLMKFYYVKCSYYVGFDIDKEGLISATDGAISRYEKFRRGKPNFPSMTFLQADGGTLLNYEDQNRFFGGMDNTNRRLIEKYFDSKHKFDRANCQFAMHYFLKNDETWRNFKTNLNNHLKAGGYFITTVFDADRIVRLLKDQDVYTTYYTDQRGNKQKLFELKKYQAFGQKPYKTGIALELFAAWMFNDDRYVTEYLVDKDFIVPDLEKDCDLVLVETDTFDNQYEIQRDYLLNYAKYDENKDTRNFLLNAASYYEHNELNGACFKYTELERYYIFRKRDDETTRKEFESKSKTKKMTEQSAYTQKVKKADIEPEAKPEKVPKGPKKSSKILKTTKQKGGKSVNDLINESLIVDLEPNEYTYYGSLYHILQHQNLIPQHITFEEFRKDFDLNTKDKDMTDAIIADTNKRIIIDHDIENSDDEIKISRTVVDGLSVVIADRDCNGFYDCDIYGRNTQKAKVAVIVRDDTTFKPVYHANKGLFNLDDEFIQRLIK